MKYAAPLFILRNKCEKDLFAVLAKLKEKGFDGIEFLGFFGHEPQELATKLQELNLQALGNHVDFATFDANPEAVIAAHKTIGCQYITLAGGLTFPYEEENFNAWVHRVTEIGRMCRSEGVTLLYHNHAKELVHTVHGEHFLMHILNKAPADALALEPDLGWMAIGGATPKDYLLRYKDRCPVLHLKDYYSDLPLYKAIPGDVTTFGDKRGNAETGGFEFRPTGYGVMNYPALTKAMLDCKPEWIVLDHDLAYDRDAYADLEISLTFTKNLLGLHHS